ncbi:MAG: ROK family protein [Pirellulaceae bacterium]
MDKDKWIGFDLGGTKMLAVVYDSDLKPLGRRRRRTKGNSGAETVIERIVGAIQKALDETDTSVESLAGIGIGCPGPVDPNTGLVHLCVNLGWENVNIGKILSKHFGCPVQVLNDVDAGVYGEYVGGAARSSRCAVGIFPGTGIGGGCVYEDTILHGADITCMEIGHTRISSGSRTSGYDLSGTLEAEASRLAIAAEAGKAAYRGMAPHLYKAVGTEISEIRSGVLADSVKNGDTEVKELIEEASRTIGLAVVNIVHLLAPDTIVMGGGLVEAMPDLIIGTVNRTAKKAVLAPYRDRFKVVQAELGDDATALGCAAWARKQTSRAAKA